MFNLQITQEKYLNDPKFNYIVDWITQGLISKYLTYSDVRDALPLAIVKASEEEFKKIEKETCFMVKKLHDLT